MIGLTAHHTFYYYPAPADMRKGFDGLSGLVHAQMGMDPADGSVYIFVNRRRDRMKLLVWEAGGFMLYYKRLEGGTFELPAWDGKAATVPLTWSTLMLLISGISLKSIKQGKRYLRA
jgi:transposase